MLTPSILKTTLYFENLSYSQNSRVSRKPVPPVQKQDESAQGYGIPGKLITLVRGFKLQIPPKYLTYGWKRLLYFFVF